MSKYFFLLLFIFCVARAQDVPATPTPPFLSVPDDATWTMTASASSGSAPASPGTANANSGVLQLKSRTVTKKGKIQHSVSTWADGTTNEAWIVDGKWLIVLPNNRGVHLLDPRQDPLAAMDATRFDFLNSTWLSPETFVAKESTQGHVCYHYRKAVSTAPLPTFKDNEEAYAAAVAARQKCDAWVDAATKQMVAYNNGITTYVFTFGPPPADLTLPPECAQLYKKYQEVMNPLHVPVAPH